MKIREVTRVINARERVRHLRYGNQILPFFYVVPGRLTRNRKSNLAPNRNLLSKK